MKKRPYWLKLLALSIALVPLFAVMIFLSVDKSFLNQIDISLKMELIFLAVGSYISVYGIWKAKPWGFRFFLVYTALIVSFDIIDYMHYPLRRNVWHFVDWTLALAGFALILRKKNRDLFFNKNLRWWESATRFSVDLPIVLLDGTKEFNGKITNISQSGCLATVPLDLGENSKVVVSFKVEKRKFHFSSIVARRTATHQYGLKFENPRFIHRMQLGWALRGSNPPQR